MANKRSVARAPAASGVGIVPLAATLATLAGACGGMPPALDVPASFPPAALQAVDSSTGTLHIELRSAPEPLVRGRNLGQFTVVDGAGQPVEGLTMTVLPWMPSDGHGTSPVGITDAGGGVFVANPLYLFMAGEWQLKMTFAGSLSDTATAIVAIP